MHATSPYISVYAFDGGVLTKLANPASLPSNIGLSCAWSPDSRYLTFTTSSSEECKTYIIEDGTFRDLFSNNYAAALNRSDVAWSPNGKTVAYAITTSPFTEMFDTVCSYYADGTLDVSYQ